MSTDQAQHTTTQVPAAANPTEGTGRGAFAGTQRDDPGAAAFEPAGVRRAVAAADRDENPVLEGDERRHL